MKRLHLLFALILIATVIGGGVLQTGQPFVYAAATAQVTINAPTKVAQFQQFVARVDIVGVENFDACNYDISFDPTVLQIIDKNPATPETDPDIRNGLINSVSVPVDIVNIYHQGTGPNDLTVIRVVENIGGLTGVSGSGYLAELHFRAIGLGNSSIGISNGVLSNTQAQAIPATWAGASLNVGIVIRNLPAIVLKGQTFDVTINFNALANDFNGVGITDFAPTGWVVQVDDPETDPAWCTPNPMTSNAVGNQAQYAWSGPYSQGHAFTAVYKVTVPADAAPGNYQFTNGRLEYFVLQTGPTTVNITVSNQVEVVEGARIQGETWDAKGGITPPGVLAGVTVTIDGGTFVISDAEGKYQLIALTTGTHTLVASKTGFRSYTRTINVTNLVDVYTLKFKGTYGLIPNAPNLTYVLTCINKWKFPPVTDPEQGLNLTKVLSAINAWKFPKVITLSPTSGAAGTIIMVSGNNFSSNTAGDIWFDTNGNGIKDASEPQASVTTTATGAIPTGVTLTVPSVAAATYQVCVDIPAGSTIEVIANFTVTP